MSAGDNFDTTREGETSYKTKRHTGHFPLHQTYMSGKDYAPQYYKSDDNLGHPCNAGCGCKEVCDPNLTATGETGCLLPPELTIRVAQASSRQGARDKFEKKVEGKDFKTYHLKYENGTWRGRRCCTVDPNTAKDLCDPCLITTRADGSKSDCTYSGREGANREAPMGTPTHSTDAYRSRGMSSRTRETLMGKMSNPPTSAPHAPDPTAGEADWIPQPRNGGTFFQATSGEKIHTCLEDGSVVSFVNPYCEVLDIKGNNPLTGNTTAGFFEYDETASFGEAECANGESIAEPANPAMCNDVDAGSTRLWRTLRNITSDKCKNPKTVSITYSFIKKDNQDSNGKKFVTLKDHVDGSVDAAKFKREIGSAFNVWKRLFEDQFPWLTLNFTSLDDETGTSQELDRTGGTTYDLPHKDNIGDIRIGMQDLGAAALAETFLLDAQADPGSQLGLRGGVAGEIIFNKNQDWRTDGQQPSDDPDAFSVMLAAAHEIGNSLGLGHSSSLTSLMKTTMGADESLDPDGSAVPLDGVLNNCINRMYGPITSSKISDAKIGRCVCIENCENSTELSVSLGAISQHHEITKKNAAGTELLLNTKDKCENTIPGQDPDPLHEKKYGKTKWFPAQCVVYDDRFQDSWRLAKNCKRMIPAHCEDSEGKFIHQGDEKSKPKYPTEETCLSSNKEWVAAATPPHCKDKAGNITNHNNQKDCLRLNNKWAKEQQFSEIIVDKNGCLARGYCIDANGKVKDDVNTKKDCEKPNETLGESTTGDTWYYNTWTTSWKQARECVNTCCGGNFVGQQSSAHQPNLSSGGRMGGVAARPGGQSDNICVTPYDEAILIDPGKTAAQTNLPCIASQGVGPPSSTGAGRGEGSFILILRGCDFHNDCTTLDDPNRGGRITVLYIPLDQILNCSNLDLNTSKIDGTNDNVAAKASYSFEFTNPSMEHYPLDKNAASPYLDMMGFERFTIAESPIYIYQESRKKFFIRPPGDHDLTKLNMQYGPFKATETKQNYHKTYSQASQDSMGYTVCACTGGCFSDSGVTGSDPNGRITPKDFWTEAECKQAGFEWHTGCPQNFDANNPVFESCPVESASKWFDRDIVDPGTGKPVDWYNVSQQMLKICKNRRAHVDGVLRSKKAKILYKHPCEFTTSYCQYHDGVGINDLIEPLIVGGPPSQFGNNNLDYWADTGLYPQNVLYGDVGHASIFQPSHVTETCFGNEYSGNVEHASNTMPIVIKSSGHDLTTGDAVTVNNVSGNFAANVLTNAKLDEIHWDFKKSKACKGEHCNKVVNPKGKCVTAPYDTSGQPKGPVPLALWVVDVIDEDHFALYDCNGDPSDGRVWYNTGTDAGANAGFGRDEPCPPVCGYSLPVPKPKHDVPVWEVCPYTGFWESPSASDPSQLFGKTKGWRAGGFGFFKIDEVTSVAQDWYVDIEQTEVCPVCSDHFMPLELVATVKDPGTLILDSMCGFDCEGDLEPVVKTGHIGPDGLDGVIGGGHCCECAYGCTNPKTKRDMPCGCWKCSDRTRSGDKPVCRSGKNSAFKKARCKNAASLDKACGKGCEDDDCCSCDCCPGSSKETNICKKKYPTISDWHACNMQCGEEGSPTKLGELECEKKIIYTCKPNPMNPFGDPSVCFSKGTQALCQGVSGGACEWMPQRVMNVFTPCLGYPSSRDLKCEGKFICIKDAANSEGQTCTQLSPADGGAYFNKEYECMGIDLPGDMKCQDCSGAIVTGCDKFEYKEREQSCPGFPKAGLDIPMKWDGIKWISEWVPMGKVGTKQCHKFADTPTSGKGVTGSPFCTGGDCNFCGPCNEAIYALSDPRVSIGDAPEDKWYMQLVMGCGSAIDMGGHGLPTFDSYFETGLNMRMNITTCRLPTGGPGKYLGPCPGTGGCEIEGFNCGPRIPCTDCCSFTKSCEIPLMYGMDPAACLNLQGEQLKGNEWRTFKKEPEVFEVYYVDMDDEKGTRGYDLLVGRQIGGRACGWYAGRQVQRGGKTVTLPPDRVSIGLADRTAAETGGKHFGSNNVGGFTLADADNFGPNSMLPSSTDRLSANTVYPESTYLVEDIEKPRRIPVNWEYHKDFSQGPKFTHTVEDITVDKQPGYRTLTSDIPTMEVSRRVDSIIPSDVMTDVDPDTGFGKPKPDGTANYPQWVEIKVKDATKLTSHNRALDRYLYRGTRQEPWPYGDAPWPVPHQSEFNVPQGSVYDIGANFPGPLNNLFRTGKKAEKSNILFDDYFIADEPLLNPVPEKLGFFELVETLEGYGTPVPGIAGRHLNTLSKVEEVKINGVPHIQVTTAVDHDLKNGEKIWLDEVVAEQGVCKMSDSICQDENGNDVTSTFDTKAKCEVAEIPPNNRRWFDGRISKRKVSPDASIKVDEDYCKSADFGICKTSNDALGIEVRLNPNEIKDKDGKYVGVLGDAEGNETNAILDKSACLRITKDEDKNDISPVWQGPGTWINSGVVVKGCVGADSGGGDEDWEESSSDTCSKCYMRCRMAGMFWNSEGACDANNCCGRDDYCPSSEANGEWVVSNVSTRTFTIHYESYIDPEPNDAIDATGAVSLEYDPTAPASFDALTTKHAADGGNKIVPGHPMGHEVGIGKPAAFGEFYENSASGLWTRHGGLFRIVVGSHEGTPYPGMDARQANTEGPVDLDFQFIRIPEACCNIHTPVGDNACASDGWPGYGPSSARSEKLDGIAFIANVTEGR